MSTKIYTGLISTNPNVFETMTAIKGVMQPMFHAAMKSFVDVADKNREKTWRDVFALHSPLAANWGDVIGDGNKKFDITDKVYQIMLELKECSMNTFSPLDIGYDVILLPNARGKTLPPLVLVFSERMGDQFRKALVEAGVVEEYGYWDNTDRPDNITKAEWKKRKAAWESIGYEPPTSSGLSIAMPTQADVSWEAIRGGMGL